MKDSNPFSESADDQTHFKSPAFWDELRSPGLTPAFKEIRRLAHRLPMKCAVASYKLASHLIWVPVIGGTGTGKSTVFNALCGRRLSATGVERPKTCGPVLFGHRETDLGPHFPFQDLQLKRRNASTATADRNAGAPGELLFLEHDDPALKNVILVDTPDVDSLELNNRQMVADLYLLADLVIFVASQEKYADDVPFQFLDRIRREGKPFFLLVNKTESRLTAQDILTSLDAGGASLPPARVWMLPFAPMDAEQLLRRDEAFKGFCAVFADEISERNQAVIRQRERGRLARELKSQVDQIVEALATESQAGRQWLEHLDVFFDAACNKALEAQERHLSEENRAYIQREIRKHFSKYDLLGKPRRMVARVVLSPFRALGLMSDNPAESHEETLKKMRERMDFAPVMAAIEAFNREVLEKLSPKDVDSPLRRELRRFDLALTREEVRQAVWDGQERLLEWLERTFQELAKGIPRTKEIGIYSTSILWGGLILSLEAAIGGGITLLEAVLDSAIAPFVTRGAVELFAYHELQKVGRQLAEKYRESVKAVIRLQRDRYAACLESLQPPGAVVSGLRALARELTP